MEAGLKAREHMHQQKGFSLIELLIVIAIILIIATIAIPNLLRARMHANESSAASSVRSITVAEIAYYNSFPAVGYATQLADMGRTAPCVPTPAHACILDNNLAFAGPGTVGHSGYQFAATGINGGSVLNTNFVIGTTPITPSKTGTRDFCSVTDGVLRSQTTAGGLPVTAMGSCTSYPISQ